MFEYNPVFLERHVRRLYRKSRRSLITPPLLLAVIGAVIGAGFAYYGKMYLVKDLVVYGVVGVVIGLMVGILAGLSASARLREEAQLALAILRIEQNTRPVAEEMDTPDFIPLDTAQAA
ncbi:MAG: hypothetical protein JW704_02225 [Anaerolineaceae bacterium]|nr:hypothetical protein [Anaerolineaceae bacterium]MBN2676845.1 hypothetical protein [Anaerolineaceae bacterium]